MFNPLVWRKEPEREQYQPAFHSELVLVIIRIDKRDIGNAMGNEINLCGRGLIDLLQHLSPALRHHYEPGRARDQFLHHTPLLRIGLAQHRVQRRHDRHSQFPQQPQDMAARGSAENSKLMLQTHDVRVSDVEKIRRPLIGGQILLLNLKPNHVRVLVAVIDIVNRNGEAVLLGVFGGHCPKQVGRKRRDAAFARQIIAQKCDLPNIRCFLHRFSALRLRPPCLPLLSTSPFRHRTTSLKSLRRDRCIVQKDTSIRRQWRTVRT